MTPWKFAPALTFCCLLLGLVAARAAEDSAAPRTNAVPADAMATNASPPKVALELRDGCRIVGHFKEKNLTLQSDMLGKMQMPFERLAKVEIPAEQASALITLWNSDSLKARLADKQFLFKTAFGEFKVPAEEIAEMQFFPVKKE